ncbi:hypothetical protein [Paracoccus sp. KR1-242]|uniref:hypothetical protein n=1 Tax=Paracoccus sp. KR1-242 TaxID=3410028 RepID=UPI003C09D1B1
MSEDILFLDLATQMGWCEGAPEARPVSGTMRLGRKGATDAEVFGTMMAWIGDRLSEKRYARVVFEAPVGPGMAGKTQFKTARRLGGLCAIVEAVCHLTGHPVYQASASSIRKQVLGDGRPENPKEAVIAHVQSLGFQPKDDNEADAIAGWLYACAVQDQKDPPLLRKSRRKAG